MRGYVVKKADGRRDFLGLGLSILFVLGLLILPGLALAQAATFADGIVRLPVVEDLPYNRSMEIAALGPVHSELVEMEASNEGPFVLDGANLSVIDTAGLQLLISFVSQVKSSGKKVSWDNYSVQAYQLANELGVVDQMGD